MNKERLCPLCCTNMTRGTICTECSLTQPSLRWMEQGVEPTIRGVPASQATCPQESQAQVQAADIEQLYFIRDPVKAIHFSFLTCGAQLKLYKREGSCTSNLFCSTCDRAYWMDWQEGVLHMGIDDNQFVDRMADRLRNSGVGRRIL
jgi:hypothetical protein